MRICLIERMKSKIETNLKIFLREEGIELSVAANDNHAFDRNPVVELESIENKSLQGSALLSEISIILKLLGKAPDCKLLIDGIYRALHPHHITPRELTVLLMSLHIEVLHCARPRFVRKRAVMRYIVEAQEYKFNNESVEDCALANEEYC